jgi:hypothetical protein
MNSKFDSSRILSIEIGSISKPFSSINFKKLSKPFLNSILLRLFFIANSQIVAILMYFNFLEFSIAIFAFWDNF